MGYQTVEFISRVGIRVFPARCASYVDFGSTLALPVSLRVMADDELHSFCIASTTTFSPVSACCWADEITGQRACLRAMRGVDDRQEPCSREWRQYGYCGSCSHVCTRLLAQTETQERACACTPCWKTTAGASVAVALIAE